VEFRSQNFLPKCRAIFPLEQLLDNSDERCLCVCRLGPDARLSLPSGVVSIWWAAPRAATVIDGDAVFTLDRRTVFVSDVRHTIDIVSGSGPVFGLVGTLASWREIVAILDYPAFGEAILYPAVHRVSLYTYSRLFRVLRDTFTGETYVNNPTLKALLAEAVTHLQKDFAPFIERCPGRSAQRKRLVFMRLQRVRLHLLSNAHRPLDIRNLAHKANYSVWRFIRVYCSVFGETPYASISRQRTERARRLLNAAQDCVGDIANIVGYESRTALSRAVKKRFGVNPSQLRSGVKSCARQ
jgi:AraC family transcriptional regulator